MKLKWFKTEDFIVGHFIMEYAHTKSVEEVCDYFNVEETSGLTDEQIKKGLEKYGPNGKLFSFKIWQELYGIVGEDYIVCV